MDVQPSFASSLKEVTHTYGKTTALNKVSLDIPSGKIVGLIGPDGVGKSTLLGLISGVRKLQQGQVFSLEADMSDARQRRNVGPRIAYMPQGLGKNLYSDLSIKENLVFFGRLFNQEPHERNARITLLTQATGLYDFLDRPVSKLSGGMKQKLGLCCALIHDPDLLILDEPTTGVDPLSRRQFWSLIENIRAQKPDMSILVSTAYMDEAEQFDWLVAMNAGRILATGTADALKQQTETTDLERAFINLLPQSDRGNASQFEIPPRTISDGEHAISAKSLTKCFGDFTAVDKVDFTIKTGEIFGFLGSNGCGKTTTMKMLTGLLPPTEGDVFLWGQPIDPDNLDARKRIGFMSQSFSLYSEMTVEQNLLLHARLFHLDPDKIDDRISELVTQFHLKNHMNELAGQLPLGIRQRLSLAVAIIHRPEILILDEPTSGVDPIARDEFWRTLVALSREENVTIFISTHFMNEALRCDRISLMHAGKVLAQGEPDELIDNQKADNLEQAFIQYMEDAITEPAVPENQGESALLKPKTAAKSNHASKVHFSFRRLFAFSLRESLELLRDPVRLSFAFIGSILLLLIFTYGISTDVDKIKFAVLDLDQTPASRNYLKSFEGSKYFKEASVIRSKTDLEQRLISRDIEVAIEIPHNFGKRLKQGRNVSVSVWIDGANTFRAGTVEGYVAGAHASYLAKLVSQGSVLMHFESRFKYNPAMENIYAMAPSMPALLLILFPSILMAVSVAREKEMGTITNFYVTPTSRLEFVIGKQFPYVVVGFINLIMLLLFVIFVMNVPVKGSVMALIIGGALYVAATTGLGLLLSSLVRTQVAAVFVTAVLTMMPTMQFSGMLQPVSTLEETGRLIGSFWPTTYFMHLSVGSFTKGLDFKELSYDLWALLAFLPVLVGLSAFWLKKQEP